MSLEDYNDVFNTGLFICTLEKEVKKRFEKKKVYCRETESDLILIMRVRSLSRAQNRFGLDLRAPEMCIRIGLLL